MNKLKLNKNLITHVYNRTNFNFALRVIDMMADDELISKEEWTILSDMLDGYFDRDYQG